MLSVYIDGINATVIKAHPNIPDLINMPNDDQTAIEIIMAQLEMAVPPQKNSRNRNI